MDVQIEVKLGGYPMPDNATLDQVISARISEQEAILDALEVEKVKVLDKKAMLESIVNESTRIRSL